MACHEYAVVDIETTGLNPQTNEIVEVAVVLADAEGRSFHEWCTQVRPQKSMTLNHIHGLTEINVKNAPSFSNIISMLNAFLRKRIFVAHNAKFDVECLKAHYQRNQRPWSDPEVFCTYESSFTYLPQLKRRRLGDCCRAFAIDRGTSHSALSDARATSELLRHYLNHPINVSQG